MGFGSFSSGTTGARKQPMLTEKTYDAVVHAIIDYGFQERTFQGETSVRPEVKIVFEIPSEEDTEGHTRLIGFKKIAGSLHEKSNLSHVLRIISGLGHEELLSSMGHTEESRFKYLTGLLGKPVQVHLKTIPESEVQFVDSITALDPRLPQPEAVQEGYVFSTGDKNAAKVFKEKVTKGHQRIVSEAVNVADFDKSLQEAIVQSVEEAADKNAGNVLG